MKYAAFAAAAIGLAACSGGDSISPKTSISTKADSISYAIGVDIGGSFKGQEIDIDLRSFNAGLIDAMSDDSSAVKLSPTQLQAVFMAFQQEMQTKQMAKIDELKTTNLVEGDAFLKENASKEGVVTTPSGLQYKVIEQGSGAKPTANSEVEVHYRGRLLDGTVFDSSYERGQPAVFPVQQVIQGWIEGIPLMNVGSKYEFYIPADLAYGEMGNQVIPPNATLIFEVELLDIK